MSHDKPPSPSPKSVAEDLMEYLRDTDGVCAEGNVNGWRWVRYVDGEWQAASYGGQHRLSDFVKGELIDSDTALDWLVRKPIEIIPVSEAYRWRPKDETVWEDASAQGVFEDVSRCFYCGEDEQTADLNRYETMAQGDCLFCGGCHDSWDAAGEIVAGPLDDVA